MCMRGGRWFWAFKEDGCGGGRTSMEAYPNFIDWHEWAFLGYKCQRKGVYGLGCICKADISNIF